MSHEDTFYSTMFQCLLSAWANSLSIAQTIGMTTTVTELGIHIQARNLKVDSVVGVRDSLGLLKLQFTDTRR